MEGSGFCARANDRGGRGSNLEPVWSGYGAFASTQIGSRGRVSLRTPSKPASASAAEKLCAQRSVFSSRAPRFRD